MAIQGTVMLKIKGQIEIFSWNKWEKMTSMARK